jgi:hypothetical protein
MIADRYEINDAEKQFFTQAVDRLKSHVDLEMPDLDWFESPELDGEDEEDDDEDVVIIEKGGIFKRGGVLIEIETFEIIDSANEQVSKAYNVTTTEEIAVAGIRLVSTTTYTVDQFANGTRWEAEFETSTESYGPDHEEPVRLPSDYQLEVENFYASKPLQEEREARREKRILEEEESGSNRHVSVRFTRSRLWQIVPLLQQLGPEHVVDERAL